MSAKPIAGYYFDGTWHGFIRSGKGKITAFDVTGTRDTYVNAMNDHGEVVGLYDTDLGYWYGFVRAADGTITKVQVDGSNYVQILAVNGDGVTVGNYDTDIQHGFVRSADGTITTFDPTHSLIT